LIILDHTILVRYKGVQNQTNPIEKLQTEPIQTKTAKKPQLVCMYSFRFNSILMFKTKILLSRKNRTNQFNPNRIGLVRILF